MPRCQGPGASWSETTIPLSHLTLRTPTCPGTMALSGALLYNVVKVKMSVKEGECDIGPSVYRIFEEHAL